MAAPATLTWDLTAPDGGPRRPSLGDIGGAGLADKAGHAPPRDGSHLYADMVNQWQRQLYALAKMAPLVRLVVGNTGVPFIGDLVSPRENLVIGDFTVASGGTGIVDISWAAGVLPTKGYALFGCPHYQASTDVAIAVVHNGANAIQVRTTANNALINITFSVEIH